MSVTDSLRHALGSVGQWGMDHPHGWMVGVGSAILSGDAELIRHTHWDQPDNWRTASCAALGTTVPLGAMALNEGAKPLLQHALHLYENAHPRVGHQLQLFDVTATSVRSNASTDTRP